MDDILLQPNTYSSKFQKIKVRTIYTGEYQITNIDAPQNELSLFFSHSGFEFEQNILKLIETWNEPLIIIRKRTSSFIF